MAAVASAPWPNRGRGRGTRLAERAERAQRGSQRERPEATITRTARSSASSRTRYGRQLSRSRASAGWPAARSGPRAISTRSAYSRRRATPIGWLAKPGRCSDANSQSPERSPVKIRPVRLPRGPPARARARSMPRLGIAEAGQRPAPILLGRERRRLTRATSSRHATSRGQRRHSTTSRSNAPAPQRPRPSPVRPSAGARSGARSTRDRRPSGSAPTTRRCRDTSRRSAARPVLEPDLRRQPGPRASRRTASSGGRGPGRSVTYSISDSSAPVSSRIRLTTSMFSHSSGPPQL